MYFRAYTLAVEYQAKIGVVMNQVGFPVLARTRSDADLAQLRRQMVRALTIVLFPLLALLAILAPVLVPFVFGPNWAPASVPVQILAVGGASTLVINAVGTVLMAKGRTRALLGFGMSHFLVYGLAVLLVVGHGIVAVAIAAAVVHTGFLFVAYALMLRGSAERPLLRLRSDLAAGERLLRGAGGARGAAAAGAGLRARAGDRADGGGGVRRDRGLPGRAAALLSRDRGEAARRCDAGAAPERSGAAPGAEAGAGHAAGRVAHHAAGGAAFAHRGLGALHRGDDLQAQLDV